MLSETAMQRVLEAALSKGGDFSELYIEETKSSSLFLINGQVDKVSSGMDSGVGIRILDGTRCVYVYSNDMREEVLIRLAKDASASLQSVPQNGQIYLTPRMDFGQGECRIAPLSVDKKRKVDFLRQGVAAAVAYSPLISQTTAGYADSEKTIYIANSTGLYRKDDRVRTRYVFEAVASSDTEKQSGHFGPGSGRGYEFIEEADITTTAREAARIAVTMLDAKPCPSGKMPVVIDNGFGGVIFHEACGHSLEATAVGVGASVFCDQLGNQIASPLVTAIDDGTILGEWGSLAIDDEGQPTQNKVLIEKGILKGYMIDILGGRRMNMPSTGSGRRQNYQYAPTSRMTNTYIAAGETPPEEIIADTPYGLYAANMGGGSVDPATGEFNFAVTEAYMIRDGKIAEPVRGATLIGKGAEVLQKIDRVGTNLELAQGVCGSISGNIPTDVGQPMIRVSEITVGGRESA